VTPEVKAIRDLIHNADVDLMCTPCDDSGIVAEIVDELIEDLGQQRKLMSSYV
jgi:hypothetical protein